MDAGENIDDLLEIGRGQGQGPLQRGAAHLHRRVQLALGVSVDRDSFEADLLLGRLVLHVQSSRLRRRHHFARDILLVYKLVHVDRERLCVRFDEVLPPLSAPVDGSQPGISLLCGAEFVEFAVDDVSV